MIPAISNSYNVEFAANPSKKANRVIKEGANIVKKAPSTFTRITPKGLSANKSEKNGIKDPEDKIGNALLGSIASTYSLITFSP